MPKVSDASRSILLRDAQYYLWGRSGPGMIGDAARDPLSFVGENIMKPVHDYKKRLARSLGKDFGTNGRSSDNGGYEWFRLGLEHEDALRSDEMNTSLPPRLLNAVPVLTKAEQESASRSNAETSYVPQRYLRDLQHFFERRQTVQSIMYKP